jgi:hypothetical protein
MVNERFGCADGRTMWKILDMLRFVVFISEILKKKEEEKKKKNPNSEPSSAHFYQMYQSHM